MKLVCETNKCLGCKACLNVCPKRAIEIRECVEAYNAEIDKEKCIDCNMCYEVCPNNALNNLLPPIFWKQGWSNDYPTRIGASSGGAASSLIKSFIEDGGYVASCVSENGVFGFKMTNDHEVARQFAGSKYVKSDPGQIYSAIKDKLKEDQAVLFIGLPCQVAALKNICGNDDRLYTVDLICHGTPSPKLLIKYVSELGYEWQEIKDIKFRNNNRYGITIDGNKLTPQRVPDSYTRAFLSSVDYTENCYSCRYATLSRVSDITLGDAWGQLSRSERDGASLILCQTQKGISLVNKANMHLEEVDLDKAVAANHQLKHPPEKHPRREKFLYAINKGRSFRLATAMALPKASVKQCLKVGLIKLKVMKDRPA